MAEAPSGKTVVASACCLGERCRWHGRKAGTSSALRELLKQGIRVIPVCPEMLGGLPCPRPPVRQIKGRIYETDEARQKIGRDLTEVFRKGARRALKIAQEAGAQEAYLFKLSPSCAVSGVAGKIFREAGMEVIPIW
jgi:uncharacterized protein YbbK (DUF523 family)